MFRGARTIPLVDSPARYINGVRKVVFSCHGVSLIAHVTTQTRCHGHTSARHSSQILVNNSGHEREPEHCRFGILFDIDGVLIRGRKVIPTACEALRKVIEARIPILFLTNSGCETEDYKAEVLSLLLKEKILGEQVILSHTPLKTLDVLHDKHVVVSGQGPVREIAENCGFQHVSSVNDVCEVFPFLDANDRQRRCAPLEQDNPEPNLKPIEAILLMGEPIHWEKHLQVLIDILISNGHPDRRVHRIPRPHLPVIAVNTDLLWMSEAANPRFGHGAFILCLETLYKKLTGEQLHYTAVLGKPNVLTYKYADRCIQDQARRLWRGKGIIERLYAIGDNVDTDVYGANIYNQHIKTSRERKNLMEHSKKGESFVNRIESILVRTGVSDVEQALRRDGAHLHRDTKYDSKLAKPSYYADDVLEAIKIVMEKEKFSF